LWLAAAEGAISVYIVATRYPQITDWLDRRGVSFETAASRPPQDEEFS
jgi:hypothetical protein